MVGEDRLAREFQTHRQRLRAVAYRILGSVSEADDAVQEAWLRLSRADPAEVRNLGGWLTTVVARICLDLLRSNQARREQPLPGQLPDPVLGTGPEQAALAADAVGLALLVVLDLLSPPERVAFVLHDMFGVPFEAIAPIVGRNPAAARQLASRARRRVRAADPYPEPDLTRQREVVDAFLAAARTGDFQALVAALDPAVVLRAESHGGRVETVHGAEPVARGALGFAGRAGMATPVLVNGAAGALVAPGGRPVAVLAFTVRAGRIVEVDILADPDRLRNLGTGTARGPADAAGADQNRRSAPSSVPRSAS